MSEVSELSEKQIEILKHSTAWPENYRNHFVTGPDSRDYDNCEKLVELGFMTKRRDHLDQMNISYVYNVSDSGKARLSTKPFANCPKHGDLKEEQTTWDGECGYCSQ